MKEEALKIDFKKVFQSYFLLGLILTLGLTLILWQLYPDSPIPTWVLYIAPINGFIGVVRERNQNVLKFSHSGLRISSEKMINWEELQLTMQYSSKLFGKLYIVENKSKQLHAHLGLNWWNEEELLRLINTYTPKKHLLRKVMDEHEFGFMSQMSSSTRVLVTGLRSEISFDYIFLMLICGQIISLKYF